MYMKKSHKNIDNILRARLTEVCDKALGTVEGVLWLTHVVDLDRIEKTFKVTCVFELESHKIAAKESGKAETFAKLIAQSLLKEGMKLGAPNDWITLDSEEQCLAQHNGNWAKRIG